MKYVQADGAIWRIADRNFAQLVRDIKAGEFMHLDNYGPMIVKDWINLDQLMEDRDEAEAPNM